MIDRFEHTDEKRAIRFRHDRPVFAFYPAHRSVAVYPDDKHIAEGFGFGEIFDVAAMQEIKNAIGENDFFAGLAVIFAMLQESFNIEVLLEFACHFQFQKKSNQKYLKFDELSFRSF